MQRDKGIPTSFFEKGDEISPEKLWFPTIDELYEVDTVFVMSTAKHAVFVSKIDNQLFEQTPLLATIQDLFAKEVLKEKQES